MLKKAEMVKIIFFADYGKTRIPSFLDNFYSFGKKISFNYNYLLKVTPKIRALTRKNKLKIVAFDKESMSFLKKKGFSISLIKEYASSYIEKNSSEQATKIISSWKDNNSGLPQKNEANFVLIPQKKSSHQQEKEAN